MCYDFIFFTEESTLNMVHYTKDSHQLFSSMNLYTCLLILKKYPTSVPILLHFDQNVHMKTNKATLLFLQSLPSKRLPLPSLQLTNKGYSAEEVTRRRICLKDREL